MRIILLFLSLVALVGCVTKHRAIPASQTKGQPIVLTNSPPEFRKYDEALLNSIQTRWYELYDILAPSQKPPGKVVVTCKLSSNGYISDVVVLENTCNRRCALACKRAILDPSPYPAWSERMHEMIGEDYRTLTLTFDFDAAPKSQVQQISYGDSSGH